MQSAIETQVQNQPDTVVIADDHDFTRDWVREHISSNFEEFKGIHEADDVQAALSKTFAFKPQLVIMDINFRNSENADGITTAEKIWHKLPNTSILFISSYTSEAYVRKLYRIVPSSASYGYLVKDSLAKHFGEAVSALLTQDCWIDPEVVQIRAKQERKSHGHDLTENLYEILACIALGLSDDTSAKVLCIVEQSVQARLRSLYQKFDIPPKGHPQAGIYNSRCRAVSYAWQRGILTESELKQWQLALQQRADDLHLNIKI